MALKAQRDIRKAAINKLQRPLAELMAASEAKSEPREEAPDLSPSL